MSISVSEIFTSWQGEGRLTGTPAVFVRLAGCHLRCRFCDTVYSQNVSDGRFMTVENVLEKVLLSAQKPEFPPLSPLWKTFSDRKTFPLPQPVSRISHVVLTGGEPLLFPEVLPLVRAFQEAGLHVTIETSGTRTLTTGCDLLSVSPKMRNSGNPPALRSVSGSLAALLADARDYQLKFVMDSPEDGAELLDFLKEFPFLSHEKVLLMPQGTCREEIEAREAWVQRLAQQEGFQVSPRAHLFWFEAKRGV